MFGIVKRNYQWFVQYGQRAFNNSTPRLSKCEIRSPMQYDTGKPQHITSIPHGRFHPSLQPPLSTPQFNLPVKDFQRRTVRRTQKPTFDFPRAPACVSGFPRLLGGKTSRKGRPGGRKAIGKPLRSPLKAGSQHETAADSALSAEATTWRGSPKRSHRPLKILVEIADEARTPTVNVLSRANDLGWNCLGHILRMDM